MMIHVAAVPASNAEIQTHEMSKMKKAGEPA
jgi:hypothetical protein